MNNQLTGTYNLTGQGGKNSFRNTRLFAALHGMGSRVDHFNSNLMTGCIDGGVNMSTVLAMLLYNVNSTVHTQPECYCTVAIDPKLPTLFSTL